MSWCASDPIVSELLIKFNSVWQISQVSLRKYPLNFRTAQFEQVWGEYFKISSSDFCDDYFLWIWFLYVSFFRVEGSFIEVLVIFSKNWTQAESLFSLSEETCLRKFEKVRRQKYFSWNLFSTPNTCDQPKFFKNLTFSLLVFFTFWRQLKIEGMKFEEIEIDFDKTWFFFTSLFHHFFVSANMNVSQIWFDLFFKMFLLPGIINSSSEKNKTTLFNYFLYFN